MKKKVLALLLVLCLIIQPLIRSEAKDKAVTIGSASMTSTSAVVSGTTEALAVMVRITNASGTIVAMQSFGANADGSFSATIDGTFASGTYTISVADYEGGTWATTTATVGSSYTPSGDSGSSTPSEPTPEPTEAPAATAAPTPEPAFDEIIVEEGSDSVNAVFDAGEIGEDPTEMSVVPDPEDENGAALLDAVLTDEQQAAIQSEPVELILSVSTSDLTSSEEKVCEESTESLEAMMTDPDAADKDIEVSEELEAVFSGNLSAPADEAGEATKPEIKIAKVYDFSVSLKIGNNKPVEIHDLGSAKITVRFKIDKSLKNTDPLVRRIFFMMHLKNNGKTEVLPVDVNSKSMKGSVQVDSFSPFILAYTDVAEFTEAGSKLTSSKYNAKYTIIEGGDVAGKVGVLEYVAPIKKKSHHTVYTKVKIDGITYKVTSIAANAFKGHKTLKKVTIGKYITSIGSKAFYKAAALEKVVIKSKKLKSANIGTSVFSKAGTAGDGITFVVPSSKLKSYKKLFGKIGTVKKK